MTCRFTTSLSVVLRHVCRSGSTADSPSDTTHTGCLKAKDSGLQEGTGQGACQGRKGHPIKGNLGDSALLSPELCSCLLGERIARPLRYVNCHNSACAA